MNSKQLNKTVDELKVAIEQYQQDNQENKTIEPLLIHADANKISVSRFGSLLFSLFGYEKVQFGANIFYGKIKNITSSEELKPVYITYQEDNKIFFAEVDGSVIWMVDTTNYSVEITSPIKQMFVYFFS